jgi:biotin carboxyl carrier protein
MIMWLVGWFICTFASSLMMKSPGKAVLQSFSSWCFSPISSLDNVSSSQEERKSGIASQCAVADLDTILEGTIISWYAAIGDDVQVKQPPVAITLDERSFDIHTPQNGVLLEIWQEEGKAVGSGDVLCVIGVKPSGT